MAALYDSIGEGYTSHRHPDPTIADAICTGLGDAKSIINVGAGTGSYEPTNRFVISVERSFTMIKQRAANSTLAVQASAMALPFTRDSFDVALAVLTVHHWKNKYLGLCELLRVARKRAVIFTWDPGFSGFWLADYFPEILDIDRSIFPPIADYEAAMGEVSVVSVPIPHNCRDGFLCAYWRRPQAYLDSGIRSGMSTFSKIADVEAGLVNLKNDLDSGVWWERYRYLHCEEELDLGYCLVVAEF